MCPRNVDRPRLLSIMFETGRAAFVVSVSTSVDAQTNQAVDIKNMETLIQRALIRYTSGK